MPGNLSRELGISMNTTIRTTLTATAAAAAVAIGTLGAAGAASADVTPPAQPATTAHLQPWGKGQEIREYVPGKWEPVRTVSYRYDYRSHKWEKVVRVRWEYVPGHWVTVYLPPRPLPKPPLPKPPVTPAPVYPHS